MFCFPWQSHFPAKCSSSIASSNSSMCCSLHTYILWLDGPLLPHPNNVQTSSAFSYVLVPTFPIRILILPHSSNPFRYSMKTAFNVNDLFWSPFIYTARTNPPTYSSSFPLLPAGLSLAWWLSACVERSWSVCLSSRPTDQHLLAQRGTESIAHLSGNSYSANW